MFLRLFMSIICVWWKYYVTVHDDASPLNSALKSAKVRVFTLQKSEMPQNQSLVYCCIDYIHQELANFFL